MDTSLPLLVVDDNQQLRMAIKNSLGELGFEQEYLAGSGEEACRILRESSIAAVICDFDMPGMDGLQLLRWVRSNLPDTKLPFMLLPCDANPDDLRAAALAGVSAYLIKPFTLASFHAKLEALLQARGGQARPPQLPPARAASPLIGMERPVDERIKEATVLVVDDMATNIKVIAGMLAEEGYGIKVAITGRKALEMAVAQPPDIILLDVMMPEMDGFTVCRQLKANPATAAIPVIFLSAKDQADDIVGGLELGAVDYVTKPVDPAILKARMRTHLRLAGMLTELRRQNAALADNAALREELEQLTRYDLPAPLATVLDLSAQLLADADANLAGAPRAAAGAGRGRARHAAPGQPGAGGAPHRAWRLPAAPRARAAESPAGARRARQSGRPPVDPAGAAGDADGRSGAVPGAVRAFAAQRRRPGAHHHHRHRPYRGGAMRADAGTCRRAGAGIARRAGRQQAGARRRGAGAVRGRPADRRAGRHAGAGRRRGAHPPDRAPAGRLTPCRP